MIVVVSPSRSDGHDATGVIEAGREGLPIAVDVGEDRDPHTGDLPWSDGNVSLSLTVVKCIDLPHAAGRRREGCVDARIGPWYPKFTPYFP